MSAYHRVLSLTALTVLLGSTSSAVALPGGGDGLRYREDGSVACVENGWKFSDPTGYAPAPHCFSSEPDGGVEALPPALASVDDSLTEEDLKKVEEVSVLSPGSQIGEGSFAYTPLTGEEPVSPLSRQISANFQQSNYAFNTWSTGANMGWGVGGNENIPVFSVDSANPHQNFIWVESRDNRGKSIAGYEQIMAGRVPFPGWAEKDYGWSGDKGVAIYDKSTGIWRSMFYLEPLTTTNENGQTTHEHTPDGLPKYTYASGGYILGNKNFQPLGNNNYWLSLQGGTSSVVGLANELTQIGVEEIRAGKINHTISFTVADYAGTSFPAKMSDGRINQIRAEGSTDLQGDTGQRFRTSRFNSGKIDEALNNSYRASLEHLANQNIIQLNPNYTLKNNPHITPETNIDTLAKEQNWNTTTRNHAQNFQKYLQDGDMLTVTNPPLPHTPKAGQRFTLPADTNIDTLVEKYNLSPFDKVILTAIRDYGGILTDRNAYVHAFNLEPAAGYAKYAREGKNVYKEDPEIIEALKGWNSHNFPWHEITWIDPNYIGDTGTTETKTSPGEYQMNHQDTIYLPDSYYDQTYVGQAVFQNIHEQAVLPRQVAFHAPWFRAVTHNEAGKITYQLDQSWGFTPSLLRATSTPETVLSEMNSVSYLVSGTGNYVDAEKYQLNKPSLGTVNLLKVAQQAELQKAYKTGWEVDVVEPDSPIARTDLVKAVQGQKLVADVLANDEAFLGAKADLRSEEQKWRGWATVALVDDDGREVKEIEKGGVRYRVVEDSLVEVEVVSASEGVAPAVRYVVKPRVGLAVDGRGVGVSKPGRVQVQVFGKFTPTEEKITPEPEPSTEPTSETTAPPGPTVEPTPTPTPTPTPSEAPEPTETMPPEVNPQPTPEPITPPSPTEKETPQPSEPEQTEGPTPEPTPTEEETPEPTETPEETKKPEEPKPTPATPTNQPTPTHKPTKKPSPSTEAEPTTPPTTPSAEPTTKTSTPSPSAETNPIPSILPNKTNPVTPNNLAPQPTQKEETPAPPKTLLEAPQRPQETKATPEHTQGEKNLPEEHTGPSERRPGQLAHTGNNPLPYILLAIGSIACGTYLLRLKNKK